MRIEAVEDKERTAREELTSKGNDRRHAHEAEVGKTICEPSVHRRIERDDTLAFPKVLQAGTASAANEKWRIVEERPRRSAMFPKSRWTSCSWPATRKGARWRFWLREREREDNESCVQ